MLKRFLGIWKASNEMKEDISELIIDGNYIEFYSRCKEQLFDCHFVSKIGDCWYDVFSKGRAVNGKYMSLENSKSYQISYALQQSYEPSDESESKNIKEVSFIVPEITHWLDIKTVNMGVTKNQNLFGIESVFEPIVLHKSNPCVKIKFESQSLKETGHIDRQTMCIIKGIPRIFISYEKVVDLECVKNDLECIMQFLGLMIGYVSTVEDIRLKLGQQGKPCRLYINQDYSYNLRIKNSLRGRTMLTFQGDYKHMQDWFANWYLFFYEKKYQFLREMFFECNNCKYTFPTELFLSYIRIIEGFSLRETNTEEEAQNLELAIKKCKKEIKDLIFNDDGKPLFASALREALPDWNFNSAHADEIAGWIANGYMNRISLAKRIKDIDKEFFEILNHNARMVGELSTDKGELNNQLEKELGEKFIDRIVATRNFYSHCKTDDANVLKNTQLQATLLSMKALIIAMLYNKMGMAADDIKLKLINNEEINAQTQFLSNTFNKEDEL